MYGAAAIHYQFADTLLANGKTSREQVMNCSGSVRT